MRLGMTRRTFVRVGLFAGGSLAVAACAAPAPSPAPAAPPPAPATAAPTVAAAAPTKPPQAAPTQAKPATMTKVSVGIPAKLFELLYPQAARDAGIYREAGLDVDLVETAGESILRGLLTGEFLVGRQGPQEVLTAIQGGADIRIVAAPHTKLPFVFVAQEGINSLEGLYGHTVGSNGPRAFLANLIFALYKVKGLDPTRLEYANTGSTAEAVAAMAAKKIDASLMLYTDLAALRDSGAKTVQLADLGQDLPGYLRQINAVRAKSLTDDDALLRKFFVAHSKAYRWALGNKEAIVQAAKQYQGRERPQAETNFDILLRPGLVTPDFTFTEQQIDYLQKLNIDLGLQKAPIPFDKVADPRYVKAVAEALGPYTPPTR